MSQTATLETHTFPSTMSNETKLEAQPATAVKFDLPVNSGKPVNILVHALEHALDEIKAGRDLSPAVLLIPLIGSSLDKHTRVAKQAAQRLFPPSDSESPDLKTRQTWSYIRYSKAVSQIRQTYYQQQGAREAAKYQEDLYRTVRMVGQEDLFRQMIDTPAGEPVLHPEPMSVNVPPLDDFKPFLCHMKKQGPLPADHVEFQRGVFYSDGRIDLCKQVVGPPWISKLTQAISGNEQVKHFLLGNNVIDTPGAVAIANFITVHNPPIETWYLAGNRLNAHGIQLIAESLKGNVHAKALWLKRNPLMTEGVKHIADLLTHNDQLEILDLDNVGMMDEGCEYLFDKLLQNSSLKLLYMDANNISARGCRAIAKYFNTLKREGRTGITSLFMGMNPLKDEGVSILAKALQGYVSLERLTLSSCRMTETGLAFLLDCLAFAPHLIVLDVGHYKATADMKELPNCVGLKGAKALAEYIEHNMSLKVLDFRTIHLPTEGLQCVAQAMLWNRNLLYVYPEQYGLRSAESRQALAEIRTHCDINCLEQLGLTLQQFCSTQLRFMKHTERVQHVDSLYRNREM